MEILRAYVIIVLKWKAQISNSNVCIDYHSIKGHSFSWIFSSFASASLPTQYFLSSYNTDKTRLEKSKRNHLMFSSLIQWKYIDNEEICDISSHTTKSITMYNVQNLIRANAREKFSKMEKWGWILVKVLRMSEIKFSFYLFQPFIEIVTCFRCNISNITAVAHNRTNPAWSLDETLKR